MQKTDYKKRKLAHRNSVIIVAGGSGMRMGSSMPKQFLLLDGLPILMHTINRFVEFDNEIEIIVVLPDSQSSMWEELCAKFQFDVCHTVVGGGDSRFHSVKNGLKALLNNNLVAVHDGVRPMVSIDTIEKCFACAAENGSAVPVLPANESLRKGTLAESKAVNRSQFYLVQTPQIFQFDIIRNGYLQDWSSQFTDDASVVEKAGYKITMVIGNRENIKITHPEDLKIAELWIKKD